MDRTGNGAGRPRRVAIAARAVSRRYGEGAHAQTVLDRVTLDVYEGDFTVVMGPSGAGKSTLLQVLGGMDRPSAGSVSYRGMRIDSLDERSMARLRRSDFGFVFQQSRLVDNLTLLENVLVAGWAAPGRDPRALRERAGTLLERMGVGEAAGRLPAQASGGEAQRASIARAVLNSPVLLFADEPTGALNRSNGEEVLNLLTGLNREGQGILMVTHDQRAALRGNRILFIADGALAGELALGPYEAAGEARRAERLAAWLGKMGW